jgi:hypothetical protein
VIVGASARLPIDGDHSFDGAADPLHPLVKTRFKLLGINVGKHASKGVLRGNHVGQLRQRAQPTLLRFPTFFDATHPSAPQITPHLAVRTISRNRCSAGSFHPWILYLSKNRFQGAQVSFFHPLDSHF